MKQISASLIQPRNTLQRMTTTTQILVLFSIVPFSAMHLLTRSQSYCFHSTALSFKKQNKNPAKQTALEKHTDFRCSHWNQCRISFACMHIDNNCHLSFAEEAL